MNTDDTPLLEVIGLHKRYKDIIAVNDISFRIRPGICFGLLGPNGAGKTTTIEMIEGITSPTAGEILFKGKPRDNHFTEHAGIQFQSTALMDYLSVDEILILFASFYKWTKNLDELIKLCDLTEFRSRYATRLSGGQRQRLLLAIALLNDPEIIFLDEPTTGLDPQSRRRFWDLINEIKQQGKTIILTTHYMDEAELLCDELLIIDKGKVIDSGSPNELLTRHFDDSCISLPLTAIEGKSEQFDMEWHTTETEIVFYSQSVDASIHMLMDQQIPLNGLKVRKRTLDDLFLKLTGHQLRG